MTHDLLSYAIVPLLFAVVDPQQAPQVSAPTPQTSAAVSPVAPTQPTVASTLQDGTPIKLRLLNKLDSHDAKNGDEIQFDVVNDVVVGGEIVLPRGSSATGVVTQGAASKTMGRAGKLTFTINAIKLRNGVRVPVRAYNRTHGENHTGEMVALMVEMPMVAAPFFLLIHGTNTSFPRGTEITAFVNGDLSLDLDSFQGSRSSDSEKK